MVAAGIEVVRMGEFAWGRLEPERGQFDFEWLDTAVELLGEAGIDVVLCTPTATPPKWLVDEHPEIRQVDADGTPRAFGSRRHYCFNAEAYRRETERIVRRVGQRYADSPHVVGWQTDNEYGCHETIQCYCDDCAAAFRDWCRERYEDVTELNERWGTTFWSQQYRSFAEIDPPRHTPAEHHPSLLLDYARFASDSVVDYNRLQTDLLREIDDEWFLTHNFMGNFPTLDAFDVAGDLDVAAWDSYPTGFAQDRRLGAVTADRLRAGDPDQVSLNHDLYRQIGAGGRGTNAGGDTGGTDAGGDTGGTDAGGGSRGTGAGGLWVMEQQPGDVNWPPHSPQPGEGAMRLWAHHAVAHGADTVCYFRWRRCRQGQEQYHAGLRKHDGSPDRGYEAATRLGDELPAFDLGGVDAPVALLFSYEDLWALSAQPHAPEFDYWRLVGSFYRALRGRSVQVDILPPRAPLDDYAAVVAPTLHLVAASLARRLESYVDRGGHVLLGPRSGYKRPDNRLQSTLAPGPLASLVGGRVEQHESLPPELDSRLRYAGETYDYDTWAEWLTAEEGSVIGRHETGAAADSPALLANEVGDGRVTYCGVQPGADLADALVSTLLDGAGVSHTARFPATVRVAERDDYTWVLNFADEPVTVGAPADAEWPVGSPTVPAYGVGVTTAPAATLAPPE
ncbi:MAG: beta-galactosidase [Halobaculum sp.]